jgi:hypothetical protein
MIEKSRKRKGVKEEYKGRRRRRKKEEENVRMEEERKCRK